MPFRLTYPILKVSIPHTVGLLVLIIRTTNITSVKIVLKITVVVISTGNHVVLSQNMSCCMLAVEFWLKVSIELHELYLGDEVIGQ